MRLRTEYVNPDDPGANYARLLAAADSSDLVLVSLLSGAELQLRFRGNSGAAHSSSCARCRSSKSRVILVNFGNPYLYQQVPDVPYLRARVGWFPCLAARGGSGALGVNPITGRLPISIPPLLSFGAGEMRPAVPLPVRAAVSRP